MHQVAVRSAVADLVDRWSQTLDKAKRDAWGVYADNVAMKNRLGETIKLSGFNHYVRSNSIRIYSGVSIVDDAPTIFELPAHDPTIADVITETSQEHSFTFDNARAWANEDSAYMFIAMGRPQNAQRNFFAGPWRWNFKISGNSVDPPVTPNVNAVTFAVAEGQHIWVQARISRADARLSEPFRADCFVGA